MARALEPAEIGDEELPAPDMAVRAVARSVPGHPDDGRVEPVVGQAARDVGVMVLDRDPLDSLERLRVGGRAVARVEVVGDDLRRAVEQSLPVTSGMRAASSTR